MHVASAVLRPDPGASTDLDAENATVLRGAARLESEHLHVVEADDDFVAVGRRLGELMPVVVWPPEPPRWQPKARDLVASEEAVDRCDDCIWFSGLGHISIMYLAHPRPDVVRSCRCPAPQVSGGFSDRVADVDHAVVESPVVEQLEVESYAPR